LMKEIEKPMAPPQPPPLKKPPPPPQQQQQQQLKVPVFAPEAYANTAPPPPPPVPKKTAPPQQQNKVLMAYMNQVDMNELAFEVKQKDEMQSSSDSLASLGNCDDDDEDDGADLRLVAFKKQALKKAQPTKEKANAREIAQQMMGRNARKVDFSKKKDAGGWFA